MNENEMNVPEKVTEQMQTRSIRATAEVLNKFKEISSAFENQNECLNQLISTYEISIARNTLNEVSTDISDYQSHITAIQNAFLHILEINSNAEIRIKQDFEMLLKSKDTTISDLQEKLKNVSTAHNELKAEHETKSAELSIEVEQLSEIVTELRQENATLNSMIGDKEIIIKGLAEKEAEYAEHKKKYNELLKIISDIEKDNNRLSAETTDYLAEIEKLKTEIETLKSDYEKEKSMLKRERDADIRTAVAEEKSKNQDRIIELSEKNSNLMIEIAELKAKIVTLTTPNTSI